MLPNVALWTKVVLLSLASLSHHIGLAAPNPPPPGGVYKGQFFERIVRLLATASQVSRSPRPPLQGSRLIDMGQISTIMALILECPVLMSLISSSHQAHVVFDTLCPHPTATLLANMPGLSPSFLFGVTWMFLSAGLRVWCFRTLGHLFTYEVSIQAQHALITSGPYRYARHGSYTGVVLMLASAAATCLAHGSYINECGLLQTPFWYPIRLWQVIAVFACASLWRRVAAEEDGLRKEFGMEWVHYTKAVPYRFIPYLI